MLTRLVRDVEVVQERMVLHDGTLRDGGDSVSPIGPVLEQTMPMLRVAKTRIRAKLHSRWRGCGECTHDTRCGEHSLILQLVNDVYTEVVSLK